MESVTKVGKKAPTKNEQHVNGHKILKFWNTARKQRETKNEAKQNIQQKPVLLSDNPQKIEKIKIALE